MNDEPKYPPSKYRTERLTLRPPRVDDAEAIFEAYATDAEVTRYLIWPPYTNIDDLREYLRNSKANKKDEPLRSWQILSREGEMLGALAMFFDGHRVSIGYVLAQSHWGSGIMVEALQPLVDWAFEQDHIHRVWAVCDVGNTASARVLEKLGMQREGILRRWIIHPNVSNKPQDCICYAKVKSDPS